MEQSIIDTVHAMAKKGDFPNRRGEFSTTKHGFGASYYIIYKDFKSISQSGICHGGLASHNIDRSLVAAIVTKVVSGETNYPEGFLEDYYSWLVNDSVCKDVFVTKDVKFGMEYGFILDPSAPLGVFVHACILSRVPSEVCAGQGRQEIWIKLVKDGVCWPLSVMFSYIRRDNGEYTVDNEYFERLTFNLFSYGSHSPYNLKEMSNLDLKRAVAGNLGGNSSQSYLRQWGCAYNDCSTWGGCFALFNSNAVQGLNRKAIEAYDKELKAKYGTKEEKQWGETVVRWLKRPPSEVFYPTALKHILALQEEIFTLIAKKEKKEAKVA